jgi:hypothetical protein
MDGIKAELEKLHEMIKKLEKGELEVSELLYLEDAARALYEKSIILKYKAFENRSSAPRSAKVEINEPDPVPEIAEANEPEGFDFGIFDQEEPAPNAEEPSAMSVESVMDPIPSVVEPEKEIEEHFSVSTSESSEENEVIKEVRVEHSVSSVSESKGQPDNSLAGRLAGGKLNSLIGAFGLNQRLQFINELFDGSSEIFSDAIKALDSQPDLQTARGKLADYASQFNWDPKDETVLEFVSFVNRRYA